MNNSPQILQLREDWFALLGTLEVDTNLGETIFANLINTYSNTARKYHNLEHIQHILHLLKEVKELVYCFPALQLCAWFHDYIYDPQTKDNELKSAIQATTILSKLNIDFEIIQLVKQIIISTQRHQPLINNLENLIFLDVDLAILGATPDRYQKYSQAIRKEYNHLSDHDYFQGRIKVLTKFLTRKRIYHTNHFRQQLELTARANLATEISTIKLYKN